MCFLPTRAIQIAPEPRWAAKEKRPALVPGPLSLLRVSPCPSLFLLVPPSYIILLLPPHCPSCRDALLLPPPSNRGYLHSYSPRSVSRETGSDRGPEAKTRSTKLSGSCSRKHAKNRQHGARPKEGQAHDFFHLFKLARRRSHHLVCRSGRCPTPTSQRLCLARHVCKCKCFFFLSLCDVFQALEG